MDSPRFTRRQLEIFLAVARTGNTSRAASSLARRRSLGTPRRVRASVEPASDWPTRRRGPARAARRHPASSGFGATPGSAAARGSIRVPYDPAGDE